MFKRVAFLFFLSIFIFAPAAQGAMPAPYLNITVIENTIAGDTISDFNIFASYPNTFSQTFQIQTQNGTGTYTISTATGNGGIFELTEAALSDWGVVVQCTSSNSQISFTSINNGVDITAYPYSSVTCTFTNTKKTEKNPVILIPGITGSWEVNGRWEIDPILNTYDNLWVALQDAGYVKNQTLFAFPYNWRYSNTYTAQLLKDKIGEIKNICNCSKVDVVAHSMGGLVARAYVEGSDYQNDIDHLIFIATPQLGAPTDYLDWEGGDIGPKPMDKLEGGIFLLEAKSRGYDSLYEYIRNFPIKSVEELLPTYDYLKENDTGVMREYPENYPQNDFLEKLNEPSNIRKLEDVNVLNIVGNTGDNSTINTIRVVSKNFSDGRWANGYPENYDLPIGNHGIEYGAGDGTVPTISNENFGIGKEIIIGNTEHRELVTDAQKEIIQELTGQMPTQEVRENNILKQYLLIRIFSPADFVITAPDGNRLGKDFSLNQSVNEIQGAFYSGFDNCPEFAVIPDPQEGDYRVDLLGTGNGEYELSTSYIDENHAIDNDVQNVINLNQSEQISFSYVAPADDSTPPISQVELQKTVTIDDMINDVQTIYNNGGFSKTKIKDQAIKTLADLKNDLQNISDRIEMLKQKQEQVANSNLKDKAKEKRIDNIEARIEKSLAKSDNALQKRLGAFKVKLDKYLDKGMITRDGYDILIEDINYLLN